LKKEKINSLLFRENKQDVRKLNILYATLLRKLQPRQLVIPEYDPVKPLIAIGPLSSLRNMISVSLTFASIAPVSQSNRMFQDIKGMIMRKY
jgi:hypothetical protein